MGLGKKIVEKVEDAVFGRDERVRGEIEKDLKDFNEGKDKKP
jgi:hypothetical protein